MNFVQEFNQCLKETTQSQKEIAKAIGVSQQTITEYKKGRISPSLEVLWKICKYFDISPNEILGWEG